MPHSYTRGASRIDGTVQMLDSPALYCTWPRSKSTQPIGYACAESHDVGYAVLWYLPSSVSRSCFRKWQAVCACVLAHPIDDRGFIRTPCHPRHRDFGARVVCWHCMPSQWLCEAGWMQGCWCSVLHGMVWHAVSVDGSTSEESTDNTTPLRKGKRIKLDLNMQRWRKNMYFLLTPTFCRLPGPPASGHCWAIVYCMVVLWPPLR